jgi:3-phenylpropionate/cinnamic acid dioxygenase small subunit
MSEPATATFPVSLEETHEVEQFLYREARLLDERRYDEWMTLLADDLHYWMPTRQNKGQSRGDAGATVEKELSGPEELAFFDESKLTMVGRVLRLGTGQAWGENPPSRTRRFVTNVEVERSDAADELLVHSNLLAYRSRRADDAHWFVASREDRLRRSGESFQLVERRVVLDANVLQSPNLSLFL